MKKRGFVVEMRAQDDRNFEVSAGWRFEVKNGILTARRVPQSKADPLRIDLSKACSVSSATGITGQESCFSFNSPSWEAIFRANSKEDLLEWIRVFQLNINPPKLSQQRSKMKVIPQEGDSTADLVPRQSAAATTSPASPRETLPFKLGYIGKWKGGKMHGYGRLALACGHRYEGQWVDGMPHGNGMLTYASGTVYCGKWKHGKRSGKGLIIYADGCTYTGAFVDGKYHGKGTIKWVNGNSYSGAFKDGVADGDGVFLYANGTKYVGGFKSGKESGMGTMFYPNGTLFHGSFQDGLAAS